MREIPAWEAKNEIKFMLKSVVHQENDISLHIDIFI